MASDRPPRVIAVGEEPPPLRPTTASTPAASATGGDRRSGGRWRTLNAFVDRSARLVDPTAAAVWLVLFRFADRGGVVRASAGRVAASIGRHRLTVLRAIKRLRAAGLLSVVDRGGLHSGAAVHRLHAEPRAEIRR
jgi:hypothetical protein